MPFHASLSRRFSLESLTSQESLLTYWIVSLQSVSTIVPIAKLSVIAICGVGIVSATEISQVCILGLPFPFLLSILTPLICDTASQAGSFTWYLEAPFLRIVRRCSINMRKTMRQKPRHSGLPTVSIWLCGNPKGMDV